MWIQRGVFRRGGVLIIRCLLLIRLLADTQSFLETVINTLFQLLAYFFKTQIGKRIYQHLLGVCMRVTDGDDVITSSGQSSQALANVMRAL